MRSNEFFPLVHNTLLFPRHGRSLPTRAPRPVAPVNVTVLEALFPPLPEPQPVSRSTSPRPGSNATRAVACDDPQRTIVTPVPMCHPCAGASVSPMYWIFTMSDVRMSPRMAMSLLRRACFVSWTSRFVSRTACSCPGRAGHCPGQRSGIAARMPSGPARPRAAPGQESLGCFVSSDVPALHKLLRAQRRKSWSYRAEESKSVRTRSEWATRKSSRTKSS